MAVAEPVVGRIPNVRTEPVASDAVVWRFPYADLVSAAAGFFEAVPHDVHAWHEHAPGASGGVWTEGTSAAEGPRFWLRIAPGNVQVYRLDQAKREAARARLSERRAKDALMNDSEEKRRRDTPMAFDDSPPRDNRDGDSGVLDSGITSWSSKSQRRLIQAIGRLDLAPIVGGARPPALVTLTLPGDWLAVCPDAASGVAILKRFEKKWLRKWGVPLRCIWKREFQRRGAPHWHLWLSPPADTEQFAPWLSNAWTDSLMIDTSTVHGMMEDRNSRLAGTGIDYRRAADARNPQLLAHYFLKETLGGEAKAYQNRAPKEWDGKSVGRFWGVKGLGTATVDVPVSTDDGVRVWRALRFERATAPEPLVVDGSQLSGWSGRRPVITARRVLRCGRSEGHDHSRRCYRVQRRRAVAPPAAGWVVTPDGPGLALRLAKLLEPATPGKFGWPAPGESLLAQLLDSRALALPAL